jgi:hypothetical protein
MAQMAALKWPLMRLFQGPTTTSKRLSLPLMILAMVLRASTIKSDSDFFTSCLLMYTIGGVIDSALVAEQKASCELYAILKRDDEKVVTERAYDNPAFVEDLVRDIAVGLNANDNIDYYRLESENFESIHNHSAYALIENKY